MAFPRVFVSSTCYDLGEVRDNLFTFIKSLYFEPVLSERGDVFYHPDLHTHESCIHEIENCQLFILIIGGRFGGNYKSDPKKSIVNAEYIAARENDIPVFCFVKKEVYEDHRIYQRNKDNKNIIHQIVFPAIEKQEYSLNIFKFIDEVSHSPVNNGIFPFEFAKDIQETLGKQWAGMFCDFITKSKYQKQLEITSNLLSQLTIASKKTEEIVKNVYIYLDKEKAPDILKVIDLEAEAKRFFESVLNQFGIGKISVNEKTFELLITIKEDTTWIDFLILTDNFYKDLNLFMDNDDEESIIEEREIIIAENSGIGLVLSVNNDDTVVVNSLGELFKVYIKLNYEQRKNVLGQYIEIKSK